MESEFKGRIIIGYFNKGGFYQDIVPTNHRHLDDLIIDFKRMIKSIDINKYKNLAGVIVYAIGEVDDELGRLIDWPKKEFIVQFPEVVIDEVKD